MRSRCLPARGFHVPHYAENFATCARAFCGALPVRRTVATDLLARWWGRAAEPSFVSTVHWTGAMSRSMPPIGIDVRSSISTSPAKKPKPRLQYIRQQQLNVGNNDFLGRPGRLHERHRGNAGRLRPPAAAPAGIAGQG